jgi:RimJ/RimL family protein N-acetyltransferase
VIDDVAIAMAILDSHRDRVGEDLVGRTGDPRSDALLLRDSEAVVLCHDGSDDPRFVYANGAAAIRWSTDVAHLIGLPSRLSAAEEHRGERAGALATALTSGVHRGYRGERQALDGTSFEVDGATLWTVDGLPDGPGQAATFTRSTPAPPDSPPATSRLSFRRWNAADAAVVLDMYSRPEVYRFLGAKPSPIPDLDQARQRIDAWTARCRGLTGLWAIEHGGTPVGTALLVPLPRSDGAATSAVEIGWHLHPDAWGMGLATEAALALVERARRGGLHEVHAVVYPDNVRSRAVCARLGMSDMGPTGEWYGVEVVDHVLRLDGRA